MADCGTCGFDISKCSCDYGVIQNANEEQSPEPCYACSGFGAFNLGYPQEGRQRVRESAAWEK